MNKNTDVVLSALGAMVSVAALVLLIVRVTGVHAMPLGLPSALAIVGMVLCSMSARRNSA